MSLLIKHGEIVTAERRWRGDIRCREGRIVELGENLESAAGEDVLDAHDLMVFPGGVDPHVHMELPVAGTVSSDDFETGTAAGLAGGTTTVIDFVHPERGEDFMEALEARKQEAAKAVADYGLHMAVTWWGDNTEEWIERCVHQEGISSFKIYMAYLASVGLRDDDIIRVLEATAGLDALVLVHAEQGDVVEGLRDKFFSEGQIEPIYHPRSRPPKTEGDANVRIAELGAQTDRANLYVVHVTCRQAVEAIAAAQGQGQRLWAETCPQYLLLDESVYELPDFAGATYVIAPPIRAREHQEVLWQALAEGVLQVVSTDHCPFNFNEQKELGRNDFQIDPGWSGGRRESAGTSFHPRGWAGADRCAPVRGSGFYESGEDLRSLSTQRCHPSGCGCRSGVVGPDGHGDDLCGDPPPSLRPQHLRGLRGDRHPSHRDRQWRDSVP